MAPASHVAPIDKLSLPPTIVLAVGFLGEPLGWRLAIGVLLMSAGALFTLGLAGVRAFRGPTRSRR